MPSTGRPAAGATQSVILFSFVTCCWCGVWQAGPWKKLHAAPVHHESTRVPVPVPAWGSVPGTKSPVHQSARFCSPKVHALGLHLSLFHPRTYMKFRGPGREQKLCQHLPHPWPLPPSQALPSPSHKAKPALSPLQEPSPASPMPGGTRLPPQLQRSQWVLPALRSGPRVLTSTQGLRPPYGCCGAAGAPSLCNSLSVLHTPVLLRWPAKMFPGRYFCTETSRRP